VTASEAYGRSETCLRLARTEANEVRRKTLQQMSGLWKFLAEHAPDLDERFDDEYERLLAVQVRVFEVLEIQAKSC
jgi:hypothetical protein